MLDKQRDPYPLESVKTLSTTQLDCISAAAAADLHAVMYAYSQRRIDSSVVII